jgi:hypothetical protein
MGKGDCHFLITYLLIGAKIIKIIVNFAVRLSQLINKLLSWKIKHRELH